MSKIDEWSDLRWITASAMTVMASFPLLKWSSPQIWGQLGQFYGIWLQPYAVETAYQWLKHFVYVKYGCMKWSEVDISLKHDVIASFPLLNGTWVPKSGANLAGVTIRVEPYALKTAYQWLKHFVYVAKRCMKWSEVNISLNHDPFGIISDDPFGEWIADCVRASRLEQAE